MARRENKLIITYTALNEMYQNGKLMYIAGRENAGPDDMGTIVAPLPAQDVDIEGAVPDPVLFSYCNTKGGKVRLRVLLVKIISKGGQPSTCTVSVYVPSVDGDWISKTENVTLVDADNNPVVFNPHSMADVGDRLCFIDYETQHVDIVSESALEAAGDGTKLKIDTFDLSGYLEDENAKGQALIAMGGKLYALFLSANRLATEFDFSQLLRLGFDSAGTLTFEQKTIVGKNAQSIIPVKDNNGKIWLLIPAIGGPQHYDGTTNGTNSNICVVDAEAAAWPDEADIKLTGNPMPESTANDPNPGPDAYNILAIGAAMRNGCSKLFILTQVYNDNARNAFWQLYRITVTDFLAIPDGTTIADAASLALIDNGIVEAADSVTPYSIYFWDLLYEQSHKDDEEEDRLWIALGSPILVTKPSCYSSPTKPNGPFIMYFCIGGVNVNSMDVPIETWHQAKRENLSLKRGLRSAGRPTAVSK
jgi:hypothetical protein